MIKTNIEDKNKKEISFSLEKLMKINLQLIILIIFLLKVK